MEYWLLQKDVTYFYKPRPIEIILARAQNHSPIIPVFQHSLRIQTLRSEDQYRRNP
jgi:hypothetical protein